MWLLQPGSLLQSYVLKAAHECASSERMRPFVKSITSRPGIVAEEPSFRLRRKGARASGPCVMFDAEARLLHQLQPAGLRATCAKAAKQMSVRSFLASQQAATQVSRFDDLNAAPVTI